MIFQRLIEVNGICLTLSESDNYTTTFLVNFFLPLMAETTFLSIYTKKIKIYP